jgi:hypothetical protein
VSKSVEEIAAGLGDVDREFLADLIFGYRQTLPYRAPPYDGAAPIDCGGTNCSDHSYRFTKLVKLGLAEHRKRGLPWGSAPTNRRGSKVYRPTPLGLAVRALIESQPHAH